MNIFVTDPNPVVCAQVLPDKHIVKMPLECCQMLSIVASEKWGHGFGDLPKADGTPYKTTKGAFRNHPALCGQVFVLNWRWLIQYGLALCEEYSHRYQKIHTCLHTLAYANQIFPYGDPAGRSGKEPKPFARAMPDESNMTQALTLLLLTNVHYSKPWVASNYLRDPSENRIG